MKNFYIILISLLCLAVILIFLVLFLTKKTEKFTPTPTPGIIGDMPIKNIIGEVISIDDFTRRRLQAGPQGLNPNFVATQLLKKYGVDKEFPVELPDVSIGIFNHFSQNGVYFPDLEGSLYHIYNQKITKSYLRKTIECLTLQNEDCGQKGYFAQWGETKNYETVGAPHLSATLQVLLPLIRPKKIYIIPYVLRASPCNSVEFQNMINDKKIDMFFINEWSSYCDQGMAVEKVTGFKMLAAGNYCPEASDERFQNWKEIHRTATPFFVNGCDEFDKPIVCDGLCGASPILDQSLPKAGYQNNLNPTNYFCPITASCFNTFYTYSQEGKGGVVRIQNGTSLAIVPIGCCLLIYKDWFARLGFPFSKMNTLDPNSPNFYLKFFYDRPELFSYIPEGTASPENILKYSGIQPNYADPPNPKWNFINGLGVPNCKKWGNFRYRIRNPTDKDVVFLIDEQQIKIPSRKYTSWFIAKTVILPGDCFCTDSAVLKQGLGIPRIPPVSCSDYCQNIGFEYGDYYKSCAVALSRNDNTDIGCNTPSIDARCYCCGLLTKVEMDDPSTDNCIDTCNDKGFESCSYQIGMNTKKIKECSLLSSGDGEPDYCICEGSKLTVEEKRGNDGNTTCTDFCGPKGIGDTYAKCLGGYGIGANNIRKDFDCDDVPLDTFLMGRDFVCKCSGKSVLKAGNNGTVSCNDYCTNVGGQWGATYAKCIGARDSGTSAPVDCSTVYGKPIDCFCDPTEVIKKSGDGFGFDCSRVCGNGDQPRCQVQGFQGAALKIMDTLAKMDTLVSGIPVMVIEERTPLNELEFYDMGRYDIHWSYKKQKANFAFPNNPTVSPSQPPTTNLLVNGNIDELYSWRGTDICGSLVIIDSEPENSFHLTIDHYKHLGGWGRGLIPYVQILNMTQNDLDVDFTDQSGRKTKMTLRKFESDAFNMETGVRRSTELKIVSGFSAAFVAAIAIVATALSGGAAAPELLAGDEAAVAAGEAAVDSAAGTADEAAQKAGFNLGRDFFRNAFEFTNNIGNWLNGITQNGYSVVGDEVGPNLRGSSIEMKLKIP